MVSYYERPKISGVPKSLCNDRSVGIIETFQEEPRTKDKRARSGSSLENKISNKFVKGFVERIRKMSKSTESYLNEKNQNT